jgi:hypothetical protein
MVEMYCKNLPLSKDLDPQESMHGEELLSMVCNVLVQVSHVTSVKSSFCCLQKFILDLSKKIYTRAVLPILFLITDVHIR